MRVRKARGLACRFTSGSNEWCSVMRPSVGRWVVAPGSVWVGRSSHADVVARQMRDDWIQEGEAGR